MGGLWTHSSSLSYASRAAMIVILKPLKSMSGANTGVFLWQRGPTAL